MTIIQDILNHVIDDLEEFMRYVKDKAAAWNELEKRSKKSKRKKHDGRSGVCVNMCMCVLPSCVHLFTYRHAEEN